MSYVVLFLVFGMKKSHILSPLLHLETCLLNRPVNLIEFSDIMRNVINAPETG